MVVEKAVPRTGYKVIAIVALFLCMAGLVAFKAGLWGARSAMSDTLTGVVAVKGTIKVSELGLTENEVKKINRTVKSHRNTFTQVAVFLDRKSGSGQLDGKSVLVMAMVLETDGNCEVRSWSRKVPRSDLVPQMVLYMDKAAKEFEQFKKYPDVQQSFKCLYI
ncbi:hypothetical protein [Pseudodesulfovibrio piezophilus]|uniref:Uncharacterized protein n=1 Tax=Pseudodesulfovibrio piezophilus (strain DSM 21447 / JCM 15486 / C1TLV30) TaxID=1322246 RepID=M1WS96_PSEP2|nr:hypothetical protein [Pseudodesulfovibrio piezophilus]CCH48777.1 conserved exported protein of unknown function [Pseudodesulfovibrio piezophilus C1TLV30]